LCLYCGELFYGLEGFCEHCGDMAFSVEAPAPEPPVELCCYCGQLFDGVGGLCDPCLAIAFSVAPPAPEPPRERAWDAEVFGVGRMEDGGTTNYVRGITSDERLAALRSMPYVDYLESPEWWNVRMCALHAAGWRCEVCNTDDELVVHHRAYERRGEEVLEDLTVLCRDCHHRFHDSGALAAGGNPPPTRRVRFVFPADLSLAP
jgi:hypothetical protein